MENETGSGSEKPIAYDVSGQPLYGHPADDAQIPTAPVTVVHMARPMVPLQQEIPPEVQEKHAESLRRYPQLDLSEHEYVVLSVRRHLIGLVGATTVTLILASLIVAGMMLLPEISKVMQFDFSYGTVLLAGISVIAMLMGGLYVLYWVYVNNTFFLTNECIIEKTQLTLFSSNVKSVGLGDVVDVSYRQTGIVEQIFNYGTVQVGTKDDEVPYIFSFVSRPQAQASILKDAVEAFKNGRPYSGEVETEK